jgi:predicted N-acetyltransferase YhbS
MEKTPQITIKADSQDYDCAMEEIYARAFGPGRHAKAAAVLRAGNQCLYNMSRVMFASTKEGEKIIGGCRLWPIIDAHGNSAIFLGPIAIDAAFQGARLGTVLMEAILKACDEANIQLIILVGDMSFFGQFGFEVVPTNHMQLPLPVAHHRLLWRKTNEAVDFSGAVTRPLATK